MRIIFNQLAMSVMRRVALRHDLHCLLHEKPFAGINGSGKHCNWSLSITSDNDLDGANLLKPGKTPQQNVRFLLFLAAVLDAVSKHAGLLRSGVATSGNEHRLGANEAPPAIISVFMGGTLTGVIEDIAAGRTTAKAAQAMLKLGVAKLPEVTQDNTDRNRTSPFAFTGAKFEFRAVGSSQSIAFPVTLLNAAVAEALGAITVSLRAELKKAKSQDDAIFNVIREVFKRTASVRFEGNNYSDEWVVEAKKRGLPNLRRTPEALAEMVSKQSRQLLTGLKILTKEELESRHLIRLERYAKDMLIECHTLNELVDTHVLPAAYLYAGSLVSAAAHAKSAGIKLVPQVEAANRIATLIESLESRRKSLGEVTHRADHLLHADCSGAAKLLTADGADLMAVVRADCDALEGIVPDSAWPLPKYREMLFPV